MFSVCVSCDASDVPLYDAPGGLRCALCAETLDVDAYPPRRGRPGPPLTPATSALSARLQNGRELRAMRARVAAIDANH